MPGGILGDLSQQGALLRLGLTFGLNYFAIPWLVVQTGTQYIYTVGGALGGVDTAAVVYTSVFSLYVIYQNKDKLMKNG
jgi:hypothetical protein